MPSRGNPADAIRDRERLIEVATRVRASPGAETSMRAVAREVAVGIGALHRRFPTRESLVEAVYRDRVVRLANGARACSPPGSRPLRCGAG